MSRIKPCSSATLSTNLTLLPQTKHEPLPNSLLNQRKQLHDAFRHENFSLTQMAEGETFKLGLKSSHTKKKIQKFALNATLTTSAVATGDCAYCPKTQCRLHSSEGSTPQKHDVSLSETCDKAQIITH